MRLFTRTIQPVGPPADVLAYASDMRALVSEKAGIEIGLWSSQFGNPVGTLVYSARVEGLAHLMSIQAKLAAAPEYHAALARGAEFVGTNPAMDALATPLHGQVGDLPPVGTVVTATRAVIAGGKYAEAVAWSIDIATYSENVTGYPVGFYMEDFGVFGSVAWMSGAPDAAELDTAGEKLNADPGYLDRLGSVGDLFVPLTGQRSVATRVA